MRISEIQEQVGRGEYHVDAHAVADAIVRRLQQDQKISGAGTPAHEECS
jgi:hypothetical protein